MSGKACGHPQNMIFKADALFLGEEDVARMASSSFRSRPDVEEAKDISLQDNMQHQGLHQRDTASQCCYWQKLPVELVDHILGFLPAHDLVATSRTCRGLHIQASSDHHWYRCVQRNVPVQTLKSPGPYRCYLKLYAALSRFWFLARHKIWFSDLDPMGKLIVVRFDQLRGCIEGYQVLAISSQASWDYWSEDDGVIIHGFKPRVKLHLDKPILQFKGQKQKQSQGHLRGSGSTIGSPFVADEVPMDLSNGIQGGKSNFLLLRRLERDSVQSTSSSVSRSNRFWPPPTVPASSVVARAHPSRSTGNAFPATTVSDRGFGIHQWLGSAGPSLPTGAWRQAAGIFWNASTSFSQTGHDVHASNGVGRRIAEEWCTYSTIDEKLYTPTSSKPWRGIWVGDYRGHGCEFLLVKQPDSRLPTDVELGLSRKEEESDEEWERRRREEQVYHGRLEAVKLTGDPNVPRGELTFFADDLGPRGLICRARDEPFTGARIVRSFGHIADEGFAQGESAAKEFYDRFEDVLVGKKLLTRGCGTFADQFIECQLILVSRDRLAQHWVGFNHISFYERVRLDELIAPT